MKIEHPTYLISELAGDVVPLVTELRQRFNPNHQWPVDITIAGSSGIGTIKEGQDIDQVVTILRPIIESFGFTQINFISVNRFPNTGIYHLVPEREAFDKLHKAVVNSGVIFNDNQWPYNPHCTLRAGAEPTEECNQLFESLAIPKNSKIECFSLYQPVHGNGRIHRF